VSPDRNSRKHNKETVGSTGTGRCCGGGDHEACVECERRVMGIPEGDPSRYRWEDLVLEGHTYNRSEYVSLLDTDGSYITSPRAHTHTELNQEWLWKPKASSLGYASSCLEGVSTPRFYGRLTRRPAAPRPCTACAAGAAALL